MASSLRHIKKEVRGLAAYTLLAREAPVKINQNENPYDIPEALKRRVLEQALGRPWSRYPAFDPRELIEKLASFSGWTADGILAGNGSNELIEALLLVTVGERTKVVVPEPTFTLYGLLTRILGGQVIGVGLGPDLEYDVTALSRTRRESWAPVTIVCSPNNPTGGVLSLSDVERLCGEGDGLVVIDEAYHEFAGQTVVPLLARHQNLVVLRTFSKAMGLAGLRIGYLLASPELVREINKARLPYNINFLSQLAAVAAIDAYPALSETVAHLTAARDTLFRDLRAIPGVRAYPSRANFILIEMVGRAPSEVSEDLLAQGILVRDVSSYPRLSRCLRVSVGTDTENQRLLLALRASLDAGAPTAAQEMLS
ncbi:MAG TPA: histidinol-phosphate transaminase [Vicinamibacteria bacterium]|nr:histidinol-phosphate transaminase [Vicinamibacteria bacterium]